MKDGTGPALQAMLDESAEALKKQQREKASKKRGKEPAQNVPQDEESKAPPPLPGCSRGPVHPHNQAVAGDEAVFVTRWVCARHYRFLERLIESCDYGRPKYVTYTSTITVSAVCLQEEVHQPA
jgi:hypothetical protein